MVTQKGLFIAGILAGITFSVLGVGASAWGWIRIDTGADIQANPETVIAIENTFNRAESAIGNEDVDALMNLYSDRYRYKDLTKSDMRKIWQDFFQHFHRIDVLHSFSRIVVKHGNPSTAQITCTGALWATSNETEQRVNPASWVGDVHFMILENGVWKILGQGRKAPDRTEFGKAPPPLF